MNLYQINQKLIETIEYQCDEDGVILEGASLDNAINELEIALDEKVENIVGYIKNLKSNAEELKKEKQSLEKRQKAMENKAERLTNYLSSFLQMNNIPKFECTKGVASFRKSTIVSVDESLLPAKYFVKKTTKIPDKESIKTLLKNGEKIKGATLVDKQNLNIK